MWCLHLPVPLLARASELDRGSGGRLAHVGKLAAWAREAHPPPQAPLPGTGRGCSGAAGLSGPVGCARRSHALRPLPGRDRSRLLPGSRRGGAEGERGCADRAGRGLSAVGGSEGESERAGHFCAASERLGARQGGH